MTQDTKLQATAQAFTSSLIGLDEMALAAVTSQDVTWTIPGATRISGVHVGSAALISIAATLRRRNITIAVESFLAGPDGVIALLHEVAEGPGHGIVLDVKSALAIDIRGTEVVSLSSYISDIAAYSDYLSTTSDGPKPEREVKIVDLRSRPPGSANPHGYPFGPSWVHPGDFDIDW
jgi:ketosteroid isomerase-like protein